MAQTDKERLFELIKLMNRYRHEYYNLNAPSVSDEVYDRLFDELVSLQTKTNIYMANSPTMAPGYPPVSQLEKVTHSIPLLSLDKVKDVNELITFQKQKQLMLMLKLDGLTLKLTYEGGQLIEASTRGDGDVGEIVTHNVCSISGIPILVNHMERLVVTGEVFIRPSDFEELKDTLVDSKGESYKNARNLAAGSARLYEPEECKNRRLHFQAFNVLEGFGDIPFKSKKLGMLPALGFEVCKFFVTNRPLNVQQMDIGIKQLQDYAKQNDIPIDGVVVTFNDIAYSKSCGRTGHHYKDGLAFKFEDDLHQTRLRSIEWTPSRFGICAPVAVMDPVIIDGCEVTHASLHNVSFIENKELAIGCRLLISKRNMIIPQVEENMDRGNYDPVQVIPSFCPCCKQPTQIRESEPDKDGKVVKVLYCDNEACDSRKLKKFVHFVSKKAMNIEGLAEGTLEKLIGCGFLHSVTDIYRLDNYRNQIIGLDGFGEKSWQKLWDAIQRSRNTTFERFLISMDIPMIGNDASKTLATAFGSDLAAFMDAVCCEYDFSQLPNFGETLHSNIYDWFASEENFCLWYELLDMLTIQEPSAAAPVAAGSPFANMTIVVTGKVEPYTRDEVHAMIESLGAKPGSSVSSKTDYLICGDKAGSKLDKARSLGVKVITPTEFFSMANAA